MENLVIENNAEPEWSSTASSNADPAKGSAIALFSGGSALRGFSRAITQYTHNTAHIITTFDSGGSSAALRQAFGMPAVGDLRCRLGALADVSIPGIMSACAFFERRLGTEENAESLWEELEQICAGEHNWLANFQGQIAEKFYEKLKLFMRYMPDSFDLRGASVGNLVLAAGYLERNKSLTPAVEECANLLNITGKVLPVSDAPAHLAIRLNSGRVIIGQHLFTEKRYVEGQGNVVQNEGPITDLWLASDLECPDFYNVDAHPTALNAISKADLICYPIGSFYSSVVANLLPRGVGRCIAEASARKVFIPNPGPDPELYGQNIQGQVEAIHKIAARDIPSVRLADILNVVVVDKQSGAYGEIPKKWLEAQGVAVLDYRFVDTAASTRNFVKVDDKRLSRLLFAMAE